MKIGLNRKHKWALIAISASLSLLIPAGCMMMGGTQVSPPEIAGAKFVGSGECTLCHEDTLRGFEDTSHQHLVISNAGGREHGCETCHGPGSLHAESGGEPHLIFSGQNSCAACHQDVSMRFSMNSHHPIGAGGIEGCVSCHDPHGDKQTTLTSTNALCTSCHQSVRGPHVFEHPPAAENCTMCHDPHGSPNRNMLTMSQPMLCLQCHSIPNNRHGQSGSASLGQPISSAVLRNCTGCHSQVHGSSADQHLRY